LLQLAGADDDVEVDITHNFVNIFKPGLCNVQAVVAHATNNSGELKSVD
jgi:hypothetical protein